MHTTSCNVAAQSSADVAHSIKFSPTACELSHFLTEYVSLLFGCGATCVRMEKNVNRIADAAGKRVDISIMPHHIHLTISGEEDEVPVTSIATVSDCGISFNKNALLSRLSWEIWDGQWSFPDAVVELHRITNVSPADKWWVLFAASAGNASFCRLFGGDAYGMLLVFIATFAGYALKQTLLERHTDFRLIVLLCSFISAILAAGGYLFQIGDTPDIALATSVLYLVPGIPLLNSFSDMLDKHYICAFGRAMNAIVITCCLSLGLYCGMLLMNHPMVN